MNSVRFGLIFIGLQTLLAWSMTVQVMTAANRRISKNPDSEALKRIGESVAARLDADPAVYRLPIRDLAIFGTLNFFTHDECQRLIKIVDSVAQPSAVFGESGAESGRTSYSGDVAPSDPFIKMIQRRIDDLMGIDPHFGETVQGQRYLPGQEFRAHFDWFDTNGSYWQSEGRAGQRSWTVMAYLNAVEEGGSTDFPKVELSIPPQPGTLIIWNNMKPDGTPNPNSLHAGTPVVRGVKYVLTKWYRARPWW